MFLDHTQRRSSRQDSPGRVIGTSQRPLPDNTQYSQQTYIHAPSGNRTRNPKKRTAADLHLRQRGQWDRQTIRYFLFLARQPPVGKGLLIHEVSRLHTTTHHSRQDSSGRVISSSQRPLPDNIQQSQETYIHAPSGNRTRNPIKGMAAELRLRPRGHWDRQTICFFLFLARQSPVGQGLFIHKVSRSHTKTHHNRQGSSRRVISSQQRPLHENTQQSQKKKTSMTALGFELKISAGERPQTARPLT